MKRPATRDAAARREFLRRAASLSVAGVAAPWALNLSAIGDAAAQSATDYKALVCVFLLGGNDNGNTVVPYDDATHQAYATVRGGLALPRSAFEAAGTVLTPSVALAGGQRLALAPGLAPLMPVFDAGRLGVLMNVGPLVQPTTRAQYLARSVPLPSNLFSHNDQQSTWQAGNPEGATSGWGGRMGDVFAADNAASTFACISTGGTSVFVSGRATAQYQLNSTGPVGITGLSGSLFGSAAASQALRTLATAATGPSLLEQEHGKLVGRSIAATTTVAAALTAAPALAAAFPATGVGNQLKMVARMLSARGSLGVRRQVFFVTLGGFDTHDDMLVTHPVLMTQLGDALAAFDAAMTELRIQDRVTTFTASDFGRTLSSNGDGSDHGWGSHHFVMGGAVRGRRIHGTPPVPANGGPDDVGQGRYLPTTSVDQLGATLATWFGVSASNLPRVMPGIDRYTVKDIGLFT